MRLPAMCAAVAFLLTGCGEPATETRPGSFSASDLGACGDSGEAEGPDAAKFISAPGAWVRVTAIDAADAGTKTRDFPGSYAVVGGDEQMTRQLGDAPTTLLMHGSIASAVADALALGASVHVHTGIVQDPRHVAYGLALKDGDFAFLGDCQYPLLTQPIAQQLGAGAADQLARLIGAPSATMRKALVPDSAPPSHAPVLNPEDTAPEVLARLKTGRFALTGVPESWRGPNTVCTRIAAGWSDCVDLAAASTAGISVNYYFDPADPTVEVWLLDANASTATPLARLATLDLAELAERDDVDLAKPGVNIAVALATTPSLADVVADPKRAEEAVERARLRQD